MTVAELIEQLSKLPAGAVIGVATDCCGCSGTDVVVEPDVLGCGVWLVDKHDRLRRRDERRAMDELTSLTEDMGLYEKD